MHDFLEGSSRTIRSGRGCGRGRDRCGGRTSGRGRRGCRGRGLCDHNHIVTGRLLEEAPHQHELLHQIPT